MSFGLTTSTCLPSMWYTGLRCQVWLPWASGTTPTPFLCLTSRLLEAVAPLIVGELAILEGVTGVEERLDAGLIFIQVDGIDLWVVKQEIIVHVQLVEHPAQGVLADGQDAGVKSCREKGASQRPLSLVWADTRRPRTAPTPSWGTSPPRVNLRGTLPKDTNVGVGV